jgi:hypothetical protein
MIAGFDGVAELSAHGEVVPEWVVPEVGLLFLGLADKADQEEGYDE